MKREGHYQPSALRVAVRGRDGQITLSLREDFAIFMLFLTPAILFPQYLFPLGCIGTELTRT